MKRFYGLSENELDNLDNITWQIYKRCIPKLRAIEKLSDLDLVIAQRYDKNALSRLQSKLAKQANLPQEKRALSLSEAMDHLDI